MRKCLFPRVSPFVELIEHHEKNPNRIILRDHYSQVEATAGQLLRSVAFLREKLQTMLRETGHYPPNETDEGRFIFMIVPIGWEYIVSMLTVFSIGAAISPLSIVVLPDQVKRYIGLANPLAILYAPALAQKSNSIKDWCCSETNGVHSDIAFLEIQTAYPQSLAPHSYGVETNVFAPIVTGSLFFTSGTSGSQKGVVHSYEALLASARERIHTWKLTEKDVVLNQKPGNWMGGIFGILPSLISGACLETCCGVFDPKFFWDRIREGGVSVFDVAPTGYDRLAGYFDNELDVLPAALRKLYIDRMSEVRVAGVSGSLLPPKTQKWWTALRRGKPLLNLYGSTEVTLICGMDWENPEYADMCSIGQPVLGVDIKLVDGEIRLKAPTMFSRYISEDVTITEKSFDSEGFFKTGDCAEKIGDSYKLYGRANIDVLHFWGFTVHTGEVESALLSLPYIANAVVLPLEDDNDQERVATILDLKQSSEWQQRDLDALRRDLTEKAGLMEFKQPTVVRWLQEGEEISLTANGKISKVDMRRHFFGRGWQDDIRVGVLDTSKMEYWRMGGQC